MSEREYEPLSCWEILVLIVKIAAIFFLLSVFLSWVGYCQPAYGQNTSVSCRAWQEPRIECVCTYTPDKPRWEVSDHDDVRDLEYGNVTYLTISEDWLLVTVYHNDQVLARFEARWHNGKTQFRRVT